MIKKYIKWIKKKTWKEHVLGALMGAFVMLNIVQIYKNIKKLIKKNARNRYRTSKRK